MKKIIVIGGGASGITAAIFAARSGHDVTVLEQNDRPLKKLHVTGNGRCNLTNLNWDDTHCLRSEDSKKAYEIIKHFDAEKTIGFFASIGIPVKDRNGWVYPRCDSAAAVAKALLYEAGQNKVRIKTNQKVLGIKRKEGGFSVLTDGWTYECDCVIVSAGSMASVKEDGSFLVENTAKSLDMCFLKQLPALSAIKLKSNKLGVWSGVRIDSTVTLYIEGKKTVSERGELQLTENGISGIPAFQISRYAARAVYEGKSASVRIDFLPEYETEDIDAFVSDIKKRYPEKGLKDILSGLLPEKLASFLVAKKDNNRVYENIKNIEFAVKGCADIRTSQCASGGIALFEVDENLQSLKCPGLYFTGEALDVDGKCGGYNLQWAWSTGYAAGSAII